MTDLDYCTVCKIYIKYSPINRSEYNLEYNICSPDCQIIYYKLKPLYLFYNFISKFEEVIKLLLEKLNRLLY